MRDADVVVTTTVHHSKNLSCKMMEIRDLCPAWSLRDVWQHSPFLSCPPALPLVSAGPRCLLYLGPCGIKWKQGASFPQLLWTQVSPQVPVCQCSSAFVLVETLEVNSFNQKTQFCHSLNISWGHITHGYISDVQNFETVCFHFLI